MYVEGAPVPYRSEIQKTLTLSVTEVEISAEVMAEKNVWRS